MARAAAGRVRAIAGLRELPKWTIISVMGILRPKLLREGDRLAQQGILDRADDIFFLHFRELKSLAAGERQPWQQIVAMRRAMYGRELRRQQTPRLLLSDGRAFYEGLGAVADEDGVITGSPVSPGLVEGVVRVVFDPHQAIAGCGRNPGVPRHRSLVDAVVFGGGRAGHGGGGNDDARLRRGARVWHSRCSGRQSGHHATKNRPAHAR